MITIGSINETGRSVGAGLWLKVAGIFLIAFVVAFIALAGIEAFSTFTERAGISKPAADQNTQIVIDPKIETDLTNALATDAIAVPGEVRDPFTDRGSLSAYVSGAASRQTADPTQEPAAITNSAAGTAASGVPASGSVAVKESVPVETTRTRYESWLARYGSGDAQLDPRLFAIEDLLPVGIVDGGNGLQEVMFFSEAAGKTLSFPLGTVFFDGWLTELRPEGVVFASNLDQRKTRLVSWARSFKRPE